jgi:energy-coupling factor transport system permease protein
MITTVVTTSTKPLDLTYGLEYFMSPLKVIKFPAHEIAMTISIALRFIPTLLEETERIMKAQASRGVDLAEGKLKEKIMAIIALIVPLFISAFQRSEELANAMESRGYHPSAIRTRYRQLHFKFLDAVALAGVVVLTGLLILSTRFPLESFF